MKKWDKNALRADLVGISGLKKNFWGQAEFSKKGKNLSHFATGSHKIVTGSHKIVTGSHKIVTGRIVTGTARLPLRLISATISG